MEEYNQQGKDILQSVSRAIYHKVMADTIQEEMLNTKNPRDLSVFRQLNQFKTSYGVNTWQELYLKFVSYHNDKEKTYEDQIGKHLDLYHLLWENLNHQLISWVRLSKTYGGEPRKPFEYYPHLRSLSNIAVKKGFFKCLNIFLSVSQNTSEIVKSSLHIAAENHQYKIVGELLDKAKSANEIIDQDILLSWSIEHNDMDILKKLLDLGVSPNRHAKNVKAPIALAAFKENLEMIKVLIDHNAEINILGCYPLISAIGRKNIDIIKLLIESNKVKKKNLERAILIAKKQLNGEEMVALLEDALDKAPA